MIITAKTFHPIHCCFVCTKMIDSPAGAFFGQDVRELSPSAAFQRGIRNIHMNKAGDLRHITKGVLYYHHVVASTW